ncbi:MAG: EVE domain-containing protein, partial [Acidobacteria bacterium]|nr:EVE domain-containing protein [Acidobacteriota bacterium]
KAIARPKPLAEIRDNPLFADSIMFRQFRLSVVPLTKEQFTWLVQGK